MRTTALVVLLSVMAALPANGAAQETYTLPTYTDQQRWNRAGTLIFAVLVGDLAARKAAGMTPRQAGQASAQVFGPPNGWNTSNTPISLFRGMYRNWMSHPAQECELLEATDAVVRARCNRPYVSYFGDDGQAYGVSLQDFEESNSGFAEGIAMAHGMTWQQMVVDQELMITIRTRPNR